MVRWRARSVLFTVLLLSSVASTAPAKERVPEIPAALRVHLRVYANGRAHYLIAPQLDPKMPAALSRKLIDWVFYGDGKVAYRQYASGRRVSSDGAFHLYIASRRHSISRLSVDAQGAFMQCDDIKRPLRLLSPARAKTLLGSVQLRPHFWRHEPHLLARDAGGRYFYVDRASTTRWGHRRATLTELRGFRLWIGRRGRMKAVILRDAVIDEAGQIFLTRRGALHVEKRGLFWRRGKARTPLTRVPIFGKDNTRILIHRYLGPYAGVRFHTPL